MDDAGAARLIEQRPGLDAGHRQRLVGDDVLALGDRGADDRIVQVVGGRDMHDVHIRMVEQRLVAAVAAPRTEGVGLGTPGVVVAAGHCHDVHVAEPPHRVDVVRTDKARTDQSHSNSLQNQPLRNKFPSGPLAQRRRAK